MTDQYTNLNNLPPDARDRALAPWTDYHLAQTRQSINNAVKVTYYMTENEITTVRKIFPRRLVIFANGNLKTSQHPIASFLNDYANNETMKYIRDSALTCLEIGGRYDNHTNHHNCIKLDDSADLHRYTKHALRTNNISLMNTLNGYQSRVCQAGVQNCTYQADVMFSINSLYDITQADLARAFIKHGSTMCIAWLYLPFGLINREFKSVEDKFYRLSIDEKRDEATFSLLDDSTIYKHKYSRWRKWMRCTCIVTKTICLNIEVEERYGPFCKLVITRALSLNNNMKRKAHFNDLMSKYVKIPNFFLHAERRFALDRSEIPDILFPSKVYMELINYCDRQVEGQYNYTNFSALAGSRLRQIKIGDMVFFDEVELDPTTLFQATFSIFIMGAIRRWHRTHGISASFKAIDRSFFGRFWDKIVNNLSVRSKHTKVDNRYYKSVTVEEFTGIISQNTNKILEWEPIYFPEVEYGTIILCDIDDPLRIDYIREFECNLNMDLLHDELNEYLNRDVDSNSTGSESDDSDAASSISSARPAPPILRNNNPSPRSQLTPVPTRVALAHALRREINGKRSISADLPIDRDLYHHEDERPNIPKAHSETEQLGKKNTESFLETKTLPSSNDTNVDVVVPVVVGVDLTLDSPNTIVERPENVRSRSSSASSVVTVVGKNQPIDATSISSYSDSSETRRYKRIVIISQQALTNKRTRKSLEHHYKFTLTKSRALPGLNVYPISDNQNDNYVVLANDECCRPACCADNHVFIRNSIHAIYRMRELVEHEPTWAITTFKRLPWGCLKTELESIEERVQTIGMSKREEKVFAKMALCDIDYRTIYDHSARADDLPFYKSNGRCFARMLFEAARSYLDYKGTVREYLNFEISNYINAKRPNINIINALKAYYTHGYWRTTLLNDFFAYELNNIKIPANIIIKTEEGERSHNNLFSIEHPDKSILCNFIHHDEHWTFEPLVLTGGDERRDNKYKQILASIRAAGPYPIIDVSAAPGYLYSIAKREKTDIKGYYYTPGDCRPLPALSKEFTPYDDLSKLKVQRFPGPNAHLIDIGSDKTESVYPDIKKYLLNNTEKGDFVILKIFEEPVWLRNFGQMGLIRNQYAKPLSAENYAFIVVDKYSEQIQYKSTYGGITLEAKCVEITRNEYCELKRDYENMEFTKEAFKNADKWNSWPYKASVIFDTGIAGCGKTAKYIQHAPDALFITPTNELRNSIISRGVNPKCVETFHKALVSKYKPRRIVVDECFMLPRAYLAVLQINNPQAKIYLCGDIHQISHIDFHHSFNSSRPLSAGIVNRSLISNRIPQDIIDIINNNYKTSYKTTNPVKNSLFKINKAQGQLLAFNNNTALDNGGMTVHRSQGQTFETCTILIDTLAVDSKLVDNFQQVYTAITRHTDKLFIMGRTEDFCKALAIDDTTINLYLHMAGNPSTSDTYHIENVEHTIDYARDLEMSNGESRDKFGVNLQIIREIYDRILPPLDASRDEIVGYNQNILSGVEQGTLTFDVEMTASAKAITAQRVLPRRYVTLQTSWDKMEGVASLAQRYLAKTISDRSKKMDYTNRLLESLCKAVYCTLDVRVMKEDIRKNRMDVARHCNDYLVSLTKKLSRGDKETLVSVEELTTFKEFFSARVKYFNKQQAKWIPDPAFDFKAKNGVIKCGQGISAWPKYLNVLYSAYFRYIMERIIISASNYGSRVVIATAKSDAEINAHLLKYHKNLGTTYVENDYSAWDSHVCDFMIKMDVEMLKWAGCPDELAIFYENFRTHYTLYYEGTKAEVWFKQQSGSPSTFCMNTLQNIALTNTLIKYDGVEYMLFKGDDSLVKCASHKWSSLAKEILDNYGFELKLKSSPVGEFAGFVLTDYGLAPDIVRRVGKFISKPYADQSHFDEAKKSVDQDLSVLVNESHKWQAAHALSIHYSQLQLQPQDVLNIFSFASKIKYEDYKLLHKTRMEKIPLNQTNN